MKVCTNCKKELPDDAEFCDNCGTKVEAESTENKDLQQKAIFCHNCGNALKEGVKFCPKCGQSTEEGALEDTKPKSSPVKWNARKKGVGFVAAILVLILFFCAGKTLFTDEHDKIIKAVSNSVKGSRLVENLSAIKLLLEKDYTLDINAETDEAISQWKVVANGKNLALSGNLESEADNIKLECCFVDGEFQLYIPDFTNKVYTYDYKKDDAGTLEEEIGNEGIDIINSLLEQSENADSANDIQKELSAIVLDTFQSLEVEKTEKREFKVKGKSRACNGYEVEITAEDIQDLSDNVKDYFDDNFADIICANEGMQEEYYNLWNEWDTLLAEHKHKKANLVFYIYRDQLAGVELDMDEVAVEITMEGMAYPLEKSEMVVEYNGEREKIELSGEKKKDKEELSLQVNGITLAESVYQYKEGIWEIEIPSEDVSVELEMMGDRNHFAFNLAASDSVDANVGLNLKKGGSVRAIKGEKAEIGEIEKEEWEELLSNSAYYRKVCCSTDIMTANTIATAMQTALADEVTYDAAPVMDAKAKLPSNLSEVPEEEYDFWCEIESVMGELSNVQAKSRKTVGNVEIENPYFEYYLDKANNQIEIYLGDYMLYPQIDPVFCE